MRQKRVIASDFIKKEKLSFDKLYVIAYNINVSPIQVQKTNYFNKWLTKLKDCKIKAIILTHIKRIENDNLGIVRSVGQGVYEKKINYGPGYRLYYIQKNETLILLLCGGDKSTQQKDIELAQELKKGLK